MKVTGCSMQPSDTMASEVIRFRSIMSAPVDSTKDPNPECPVLEYRDDFQESNAFTIIDVESTEPFLKPRGMRFNELKQFYRRRLDVFKRLSQDADDYPNE